MKSFIKKVALKNYKSIAECDVALPPLCFLIGKNGAGKSNFMDALRLVSDALNTSLDHALRDRSGINEVRRRSPGHPTHFSIRLDISLLNGDCGYYEFRVGSQKRGFEVQLEECRIGSASALEDIFHYRVESGQVRSSSIEKPPAAKNDRLYLVNLSGFDEFRPLYDSLSRMGFYNLNPDVIRNEQPPDPGLVLKRDGSNLASVLERIKRNAPDAMKIEEFLSKVVPGIKGVSSRNVLSKETLEFRQNTKGSADPWRFLAVNMSDGTLRTLGILVALFQGSSMYDNPTPLIGIEEPESALHPGAAGVLRDALFFASRHTQVLVTSHSPDLLDDKQITADSILAVSGDEGVTAISPIDEASRSAIHDGLYTAGELLRTNQLEPANQQGSHIQSHLFME
ncbi:MAG TPA: chromosome segregation protein SMC [bacterium]|nr:chromosome segregation protein SMC [bacterium]